MAKARYAPGYNPKSLANLEKGRLNRFKNGHEPHPNSGRRRREESITSIQRHLLTLQCPLASKKNPKTWAQWLAEQGLEMAGKNAQYYQSVLDRMEGKLTQMFSGHLAGDITFIIGKGYQEKPDNANDESTIPTD